MSISAARRSLSAESTWMSPKPSAWAAPGIDRAIISINGFFPLDIIYSKVLLEHLNTLAEAVPIAHHGSMRQMLCDAISPGYSGTPNLRRSSPMFVGGAADLRKT